MMRIKSIHIDSLFGYFNHKIEMKDKITIIHGLNGYGKTTILKILDSIFNKNYEELVFIPFKTITLEFSEDNKLIFTKKTIKKKKNLDAIEIELTGTNSAKGVLGSYYCVDGKIERLDAQDRLLDLYGKFLTYETFKHIEYSRRRDYIRRRRDLSSKRHYGRYGRIQPDRDFFFDRTKPDEIKWFHELTSEISVRFIQTQRLISFTLDDEDSEEKISEAVVNYSNEVAQKIKNLRSESTTIFESLDRTYPRRLIDYLEKGERNEIDIESLVSKMSALEKQRLNLINVGILDAEQEHQLVPIKSGEISTDDRIKYVLLLHIEDTERKLGIFDELYNRIGLLTEIINKRFKYKKLKIDKNEGFILTTNEDMKLDVSDISSGEKHMLVVFYELLFETKPDSLILIDEPELSLHVAWQQDFLDNLFKISEVNNMEFLIATHSPQIINDKWDLTVCLEGPDDTSCNE